MTHCDKKDVEKWADLRSVCTRLSSTAHREPGDEATLSLDLIPKKCEKQVVLVCE